MNRKKLKKIRQIQLKKIPKSRKITAQIKKLNNSFIDWNNQIKNLKNSKKYNLKSQIIGFKS